MKHFSGLWCDGWCFNYLQIYPNNVGKYERRELRPRSPHYSQELTRCNRTPLFVLPSICGRAGSAPVADPHIHPPYWSLLLWISSAASQSGSLWLEPPWPVTVVTRPVFIPGSETGTSSVYYLSYNFSVIASLFVSPPSFSQRSSFPCSYLCPVEPAALTSPSRAAIVILGTWEIKSLLMSDGAPAHWNELPFVLIQTCPFIWSSRLFLHSRVWLEQQYYSVQHERPCNYKKQNKKKTHVYFKEGG